MICVVKTKVFLSAGLNGKSEALKELPIWLICCDSAPRAISEFRRLGVVDLLISAWDMPDMPDGELIRLIKKARPWLRTLVLMDEPFVERERAARQLGVAAVLSTEVDEGLLRLAVKEILGIEGVVARRTEAVPRVIGAEE
jgi:DNA-binding NarL/FixJ family response regulator